MPLRAPRPISRRLNGRLSRRQLQTVAMMGSVVLGLHAVGFLLLLALVAPHHHHLSGSGGVAVGTGLTAYTLGLRHAFDADHISAIDNTTRALMADGKRPLSVGFFFSLGHSTIVFMLALLFSLGLEALSGPLIHHGSALHQVTSVIGTSVSGSFLYLIAAINLVILVSIVRVFGKMRRGEHDEAELERQLQSRGLMNRTLGRVTRRVNSAWHMYPIGLLFGLGFDTASEVALLFLAAGAATSGVPPAAILCLPVLFAAGMSLLDTIDGSFMVLAYGWAFSQPVRRVFYNIACTGLSVAVALVIGTIELGGLLAQKLRAQGSFWTWFEQVNINTVGFIVVGMFVATWTIAVALWRFGGIEERWRARPDGGEATG